MRYLRAKHIRKALRQFQFLCDIKPPYKVLLDGNFIAMCVKMHVDIAVRVPKFLQTDKCTYYVTQAILDELKLLSEDPDMKVAYNEAKKFQLVEHSRDETDVTKSLLKAIGSRNEKKYIVATQETELRRELRRVPGVPLIYLNRSVLVFEDMSDATLKISRKDDQVKMSKLNENEKRKLDSIQSTDAPEEPEKKQRIVKRAKGPNPLSMKKSTKPKKVRSKRKTNSTN